MMCGSAGSSTTKEWMTAGSSPKKGSFVFGASPLTIGGKTAEKTRICGIEGCPRNHHRLLHGLENLSETGPMTTFPRVDAGRCPVVPWEGVPVVTMTRGNAETPTESYSLRTVPVWMKANGRKVKINAILDEASNETFLNEEVAGVLGLQEPFQKVQVHVLNGTVETFQSMPLKIEIESVDGQFSKEISVKTCQQSCELDRTSE